MPEGRILYFSPDNSTPSGGMKTVYRHVEILNRHRNPAFIVHGSSGFRAQWFANNVPILDMRNLMLDPRDIAVIPEDHHALLKALKGFAGRKIIFCQNHFYIRDAGRAREVWAEHGISHVLASSDPIADFLENQLGIPRVSIVHYAIDPKTFSQSDKKFQIAMMPRKRPVEAAFIRGLCSAAPGANEFSWAAIENLSEDAAARILAESAIFLSLSQLEGFGLPPVEAMASGCLVVGFHGYGGLEYATKQNGFWCEEGNPIDCAQTLSRVIAMVRNLDPQIHAVVSVGHATAARYLPPRQEHELLQFFRSLH
jgi:glycosyltransferase involved in cell wall biosynthesis